MYRVICWSILLFNLNISNALPVSIHYGGITSSMPFELVHHDVESPLEVVLQVANVSETTASVLGWQLHLELRALSGQGTLLFYDTTAPPDPLFSQTSDPQSDPELPPPTDSIFVQDTNMEFTGEPIAQYSARNILRLTLAASSNAFGAFELVMPYIDNPETDSSWFDADEFAPKAFDNSAPSTFPGYILLGTIDVDPTPDPLPGDYNSDGHVTTADYQLWRIDFGRMVGTLGEGADGNRDGIIDTADYVIWRKHVGVASGAGDTTSTNVPEPPILAWVSFGFVSVAWCSRRPRQRPSDGILYLRLSDCESRAELRMRDVFTTGCEGYD